MSSYKAALGLILLSPLLGVRDSTTSSRQATNNPTNDTFSSFRWIDSQKDAPLWAKVQAAFHEPLKPDPPDEAPPYGYKYISRIGVSNNSALVIIGHRIKKRELPGEYFLAFNYDLLTGATSEVIIPKEMRPLPCTCINGNLFDLRDSIHRPTRMWSLRIGIAGSAKMN